MLLIHPKDTTTTILAFLYESLQVYLLEQDYSKR